MCEHVCVPTCTRTGVMEVYLCVCVFVRTVQSTMVMCFAAVLASTSASSSLTLFSTDISRGLFSAGIRQDSYLHRSDYAVLENTEPGQDMSTGKDYKTRTTECLVTWQANPVVQLFEEGIA